MLASWLFLRFIISSLITEQAIAKHNSDEEPAIATITTAMARSDEAAFCVFFGLYFQRLLRYLLVMAHGDEELAREALQLTMVRVARHVRKFDTEEAFWSWLAVLAHSSLVDERRKTRRYLSFLTRWFDQKEFPTPDDPQAEDRLADCLAATLSALPEEDRSLITRKYFNGESVREIATVLSLSEKAVESRLTRIRNRLKSLILERLKNEK
jgi:RNA polymerase sigma-70 factor (ECF subfamily)